MGTGAPPYEAPEVHHSVIRRHAIELELHPTLIFTSSPRTHIFIQNAVIPTPSLLSPHLLYMFLVPRAVRSDIFIQGKIPKFCDTCSKAPLSKV